MTKNTDLLNFFLIGISLFLAFQLPFELFLFSYAVLGPLHYLTEINWLRQKNYFVRHTGWAWLLVVLVTLISLPILAKLPFLKTLAKGIAVQNILDWIKGQYSVIILFALISAIGLMLFKKTAHIIGFLLLSLAAAVLMAQYVPGIYIFTAIFLPTLIHVYLFTLLFMIYGTMQSGNNAGIASIVFLLLVPLIIAGSTIVPTEYNIAGLTRETFNKTGFHRLNISMASLLDPKHYKAFSHFSPIGIKIQIFVAFAYTYHYLNWFSKTAVIGWQKNLTRTKTIAVFSIWAVFLAVYYYDFKIGMIAAYFLSMGHVFLEFPLNMTSIKAIAQKISPGKA